MELWALYPEMLIAAAALLLVAAAGWLRGRWRELPWMAAAAALAGAMLLSARMLPWQSNAVFGGTYAVDGYGTVFKLLLELGALLTVLLLRGYFGEREQSVHAPIAVLLSTLGAMGLVSALDLALIVLFLQMLSFASYVLVALERGKPLANEATLKYFIYSAAALAVMAYGLSFLFGLAGSLQLAEIGRALARPDAAWMAVALALVLVGYAFEATLVPFHFWAPDVYEGSTAVIAGFISVVPKIAAFAALIRFVLTALPEDFPAAAIFAALSALSMTFGNLAALRQTRLKRLLAYSSIAQAGYVLLAVAALGQTVAASAAAYYLAAFLFMNLGAFSVAAQVERSRGTDALDAFCGIGRVAAWPGAVLAASLLSLAGIPPFAGFVAKVFVLEAAMSGALVWLAIVAAANMVVGLYYYIAIVARIYESVGGAEASLPVRGFRIVLVLCLAGTLAMGLAPAPFLQAGASVMQLCGAACPGTDRR